jgi:hypothetical protein
MGPALARQVWEFFHPQEDDSAADPEVSASPELPVAS